jgi:membrane-bound lytic murein transglycosylase D
MEETKVTFYKVKKGDTLGAIARRHHVTTKQIMKWNNLKNADKLSIGQRLRIEQR